MRTPTAASAARWSLVTPPSSAAGPMSAPARPDDVIQQPLCVLGTDDALRGNGTGAPLAGVKAGTQPRKRPRWQVASLSGLSFHPGISRAHRLGVGGANQVPQLHGEPDEVADVP